MRRPRNQLTLTAIAILLGLLLVIQFRAQQAGTGLEIQSSQDLTLLIANLTTRNDQLRGEVADIQGQLDSISAANARGETSVGQLRADLERVRIWSGEDPTAGPGVRVLLFGGVPADAISELVNELRNAGAEAIAVGGARVVASTVAAGPIGALSIADTALGPRIEVLGDRESRGPDRWADARRWPRRPAAGPLRRGAGRGDPSRRRLPAGRRPLARSDARGAPSLTWRRVGPERGLGC